MLKLLLCKINRMHEPQTNLLFVTLHIRLPSQLLRCSSEANIHILSP